MQLQKTTLLSLMLLFASMLTAQISPADAVAAMARGINLGNTLEPPTESAWNNGPAEEAYFDAYVDAGFTNIRVPVRWDEHTGNSAPYTIDAAWMNRVEEVIDWGLSRGLFITLNGHHEDWLKTDYSANNRARYDAIWRQIIERFKDKSDRLLYEIINEPNGLSVSQVDDLNERILGIIREQESTRLVIFGGNMYANAEQLIQAAIPGNNDQYLVGYYHSYDPWPFAGEGQGTWGSNVQYQRVTDKFQSVKNWSDSKNIPVHLSEYNSRVISDYNSRMRWLAHNVDMSITYGFAFSIWDDGGWFRVLNRQNKTWPEVKDIFVHYYPDSPNQIFSSSADANGEVVALVEWNNRTTGNDSIVVEKSLGTGGSWNEVATLAPDATEFMDPAVFTNGTYTYRLWTKRADGTRLHGYPTRLQISGGVTGQQTPYNASPITIPGVLEVEDYDNGGQDIAYNDNESANQGGGYRLSEGVDIGGGPNNGFVLGYVANGEWLEFTVDVTETGTYEVTAEVASNDAASQFTISFPNEASTTFATPLTNDWNTYRTIAANSELNLEEGQQIVRLDISGDRAFNLDKLTFTLKSNSTETQATAAGFIIAPNPVSNELNVTLPSRFNRSNGTLRLFNAAGARVAEYKATADTTVLDVSTLPAGPYFLHLADGEHSLVRRVVIR